jgi:hypothetical protein
MCVGPSLNLMIVARKYEQFVNAVAQIQLLCRKLRKTFQKFDVIENSVKVEGDTSCAMTPERLAIT